MKKLKSLSSVVNDIKYELFTYGDAAEGDIDYTCLLYTSQDMHCPFVINQNRYSIFDRTVEKNGLKKTTGILKKGLITFSPLAQGQLTDRYLNGIPEDSRIRTDGRFLKESNLTPERLQQIRELNDMAAGRGEKLSEMALGWLLAQQEVTSVLIGASRPQQILDNIKAIHCAPFTEEELVRIDEIAAENTASTSFRK